MAIVKKPIILDETAQSINATLRQIKNAIVDSGGGGDISSKADKVEDAPEGNIAILVNGGNLGDGKRKLTDFVLKEGNKVLSDNNYSDSDKEKVKNAITEHQDISGKADKVANATSGHLAALDLEGNLTDSGSKPSDFASATEQTELRENLTELEQKAITSTEEESYEPTVPRDADTLGGISASEYALKNELVEIPTYDNLIQAISDSITVESSFSFSSALSLTVKNSGIYNVQCELGYATNSSGGRAMSVSINGIVINANQVKATEGINTVMSTNLCTKLKAGDIITINACQFGGGSLNAFPKINLYK